MNLDKKQLIEIVGVIAVVASLIFVGMQLMLDRKIAMAEQYSNRAEALRADFRAMMESNSYYVSEQENWDRGERPPWWEENGVLAQRIDDGTLTVRSLFYQILDSRLGLLAFDNLYYQYKQGLLDEESWLTFREILKRRMINEEVTMHLATIERRLIAEVVNEILEEIEPENSN